ncbi:MAG: hypothetical protein Q4F84_09100, partial [Fibrobacter sp.]|nr:hypothetical protein [Fibrobacter sp.]
TLMISLHMNPFIIKENLHAKMNEKRIGVEWAYPVSENTNKKAGTVIKINSDSIDVQCGEGVLRIVRVKPEGKKDMSTHDFILGTSVPEGMLLQ